MLAGGDDGTLRPGALFIVGDPKQSIYRFRRADVGAYRRIADGLGESGAIPVTLQTSYRSVPAIQHFVNAAFRDDMNGDPDALQADYVPLLGYRADTPEQPAVVALPVPRPYGKSVYGPPQVTQTALNQSQPPAIAAFVGWLLSPECTWTVAAGEGAPEDRGERHLPVVPALHEFRQGHHARLCRGPRSARHSAPAGRRQDLSRARGSGCDSDRADRHRVARGRAVGLLRRCTARCSRSARKNCSSITRSRASSIRIGSRTTCRIA